VSAAFVDVIWFADDEEECHRVLLYVNLEKRLQVLRDYKPTAFEFFHPKRVWAPPIGRARPWTHRIPPAYRKSWRCV
jgi:hypothetical protein